MASSTPPPSDRPDSDGPNGHASPSPDLDEVRRILFARDRRELQALRERLDKIASLEETGQVEAVSRVLPEAVARRTNEDDALARVLAPTIEETLRVSVQQNPKPLADALFPVIGPAIRRSIAETLSRLIETVNRTLEHSLSARSIQWRFVAWRTGRPFAEVVLLHTLRYRIEQLLLIERRSGLPVQHLTAEDYEKLPSEVFSGMLHAVQDFVRDSLGAEKEDTMDSLTVGEFTVWIEPGPRVILAAVIRGVPDPALRDHMRDLVETIHLRYGGALEDFDGEQASFDMMRPLLQTGLVAQYNRPERRTSPILWVVLALILGGLAFWGYRSVRAYNLWQNYVAVLKAEPGLVVTDTDRAGGRWIVEGLRDPVARDPDVLRAEAGLAAEDVQGRWDAYLALDPSIVLRRAAQVLDPPPSVALQVEGSVLHASGAADRDWIVQARERAVRLPGVAAYDDAPLLAAERARLEGLADSLEGLSVTFYAGMVEPRAGQADAIEGLMATALRLTEAAEALGGQVYIEIFGHASTEGTDALNQSLSARRAAYLRDLLVEMGLDPALLTIEGTGEPRFPDRDTTEVQRLINRSISLRVQVELP